MTLEVGDTVRIRTLAGTIEAEILAERVAGFRVRMPNGKERTVHQNRIIGQRTKPRTKPVERPANVERSTGGKAQPKTRPARDAAHLAYVRGLPCCVCLREGPSDPHHFGPRGMGQKCDDRRTVPLCRRHHDEWHARGRCESMTRVETERDFYRAQVDCLLARDHPIE